MKLLLYLSYVGTAYCGYQVQKNKPTIQRELNRAAEELFGFPCDIVGCSRTDAGVHARMFCATVSQKGALNLPFTIPVERVPRAMTMHLPPDISVFDAYAVADSFHPRYTVVEKEYEYRIDCRAVRDPFEENRSWHVPFPLKEDSLARMQLAAQAFVGTHDFSAFMAQGSKIRDAVRTVTEARVEQNGSVLSFFVSADGFLYNMVRIMAGTLLEVALGHLEPSAVPDIIASCDRSLAGRTAPPQGLYLNRVSYGDGCLTGSGAKDEKNATTA